MLHFAVKKSYIKVNIDGTSCRKKVIWDLEGTPCIYLINLGGAGEEWSLGVELGHDAAHRPHVDRARVVGRA